MEGGKEQNYWPGFVDALSNVVLTLIFVLIIFVFALVIISSKVGRKAQEIVQAKEKAIVQQKIDYENQAIALKSQLSQMSAEMEQLKKALEESQAKEKAASKSASTAKSSSEAASPKVHAEFDVKEQKNTGVGNVTMSKTSTGIVINYPPEVALLDQPSETGLSTLVENVTKTLGKHKIVLHSRVGKESYSVARRLAYYRAVVGIRNFLIKRGESPNDITIMFESPEKPQDGQVEINYQKAE